jgi:hypothetical protein
MRHHNDALCLGCSQNFVDSAHGALVKLPPRFSPGRGNVVGVGTTSGVDVWVALANLQR